MQWKSLTNFKPFFECFQEIATIYMLPTTFLCTTFFYLAYGPKVVLLLDHHFFSFDFPLSTFRSKQIFSIIVLWQIALLVVLIIEKTAEIFPLMCVYATNTHHYVLCGTLLYSQLATGRRLRLIERRLLTPYNCTNFSQERCVVSQFKTLAKLNEQLNQLMSFPLMVFLFTNVYKTIIFFCTVWLAGFSSILSIYTVAILWMMIYICLLNYRNRELSKRICAILRHKYYFNLVNIQRPKFKSTNEISSKVAPTLLMPCRKSTKLRYQHMDMYLSHFRIKMFHLTSLDLRLLKETALFILCQVVLMTQTN